MKIYDEAVKQNKKSIILYNLRQDDLSKLKEEGEYNKILDNVDQRLGCRDDKNCVVVAADCNKKESFEKITNYLKQMYNPNLRKKVSVLPEHITDGIVFMNIPMDQQTPEFRLLRPQALVQAQSLSKFLSTFAYRMDLKKARSSDEKVRNEEKKRFLGVF